MKDKRLRNLGIQVLALAVALLLVCTVYRIARGNRYTDFIPCPPGQEDTEALRFETESEDVLQTERIRPHDGFVEVRLLPHGRGDVEFNLVDASGNQIGLYVYRVSALKTVYNRVTGGFTGDGLFLIAVTAFFLTIAALMLRCFLASRGSLFYSYTTIYAAGFSLFALDVGIVMLLCTVRHLADPLGYPMFAVYDMMRAASFHFIMITTPLILIFSVLMCISNIELLRHERKRFQNVLGILLSVLLLLGCLLAWWMYTRDFQGSWRQMIIEETFQSVYATAYVYFECMLIGAIICGVVASRHKPECNKDYCIILGCSFRKDGTLPPLLRGRVDKAIEFARHQEAATGKALTFIPSGGQGRDEVMAEAEAMKRYMLAQGIPEERILMENRSANTYQNMAFSKALIEARSKDAKVIYATTNYHVFRSGVWASLAGLRTEGIGSHTKWWYWPNAFVRECVGLLQNRWKQELIALAALTLFFAAISMMMIGL